MKDGKLIVAHLVRPAEGGIKSHVLTLMNGLDRSRFEPVLICPPDSSLFEEAAKAGHRTVALDLIGEISPWYDLGTSFRLMRILRKLRPDILHIHSAKAGLVGRLALAMMRKRPKVVLTFHSFVFDERTKPFRRRLVALVERRLQRYADKIVPVSWALREELVTEMGLNPAGIRVIHNGVVFQDVIKTERTGNRVGVVARLAPQKGLEYFIEAAALVKERFPNAKFAIVGDGPFKFWLETRAKQVGVEDSVEFLGSRSDAMSVVAGWDVFALTSTRETFGMALVEAMSQEVPVVATKVGGVPEIVDGEFTGLLARPADTKDIAEKICRLLEDRTLAAELARAGNAFVRANFSAARMLGDVQHLYDELLGSSEPEREEVRVQQAEPQSDGLAGEG